ncbi:MAG: RluA family pseudouridine synthase [Clostridia bacterium]|nr:RluA family pseudouridine synthase [Clostridia bacterium]
MEFRITRKDAGKTVREFITAYLPISSKMLKYLKYRENGICVDGVRRTVRYRLSEGELLFLATEDTESAPILPVDLPLEILYEDEDLVVPAKGAQMPTHPSHDHYGDTVANALAFRYANMGVPFVFRPINRLDRNTSGLLLIARNKMAAGRLSRAMQEGVIRKSYLAVLEGELSPDHGVIDAPLHRTEQSIIVREVCSIDTPDAEIAKTEYRVLARGGGFTLVQAFPITGRTHQLRVHFAHLGHPIVGDDLYGSPSPYIARHALHAHTLTFPHPVTQERMEVCAPPPADFMLLTERFLPCPLADFFKERSQGHDG